MDKVELRACYKMVRQVQEATGGSVELSYVNQACTGQQAAQDAEAHHMQLEVVKLSEAKCGFVLLLKR